ncbi:MAG: DUF1573 domain-containing protein [Planctomycetota bacterium]|nr:DUF1573 domain-containing protein [Planctomycetota bacterium]
MNGHRSGRRSDAVILVAMALAALLQGSAQARQSAPPVQGPDVPKQGPTWQERTPPNTNPPPVVIEPNPIDLGDLPPNTKVTAEFRVTNRGESPLTLISAMSMCWCTVTSPSDMVLDPGETIQIPVTYDSGPVVGWAERQVLMRFEGYSKNAVGRVQADTNYGVRARVTFDPPEQRRLAVVALESVDGAAFSVLSVNGGAPDFVDGFEPGRDTPRARYQIGWDLSALAADKLPLWFVVETDHPTSPIIDLPVENMEWEPPRRGRIWTFTGANANVRRVEPGGFADVTLTLSGAPGAPMDAIERIEVDPPVADVRIMGMAAADTGGLKVRLRVTPNRDHRGLLLANVYVVASGHEESFMLMGRVVPAAQ